MSDFDFLTSEIGADPALSVVYVLTNPAMPGLVKIGRTGQDNAKTRLDQLYSTGVPLPFDLVFACRVPNSVDVERALHVAFGPQRVNPRREFFQIDAAQAVAILKLLHVPGVSDVTDEIEHQASEAQPQEAEVQAAREFKARRPNLNFDEMGVPFGSVLTFTATGQIATVVGPKKVLFEGEELSLTAATRQALGIDYSVQPGAHWTFDGRSVREIYEDTYEAVI